MADDVDAAFAGWYNDSLEEEEEGHILEEEEEEEIIVLSDKMKERLEGVTEKDRFRSASSSFRSDFSTSSSSDASRRNPFPSRLADGFSEGQLGEVDDDDEEQPNPFTSPLQDRVGTKDFAPLGDLLYKPNLEHRPWARPQAPEVDPEMQDFLFQHVDTTQGIDTMHEKPIIRIFGVTKDGNSVLLETTSFRPYFYARISSKEEAEQVANNLEKFLSTACTGRNKLCLPNARYVLKVEPVRMRSMCGWHRHVPLETMYRFTMAYPGHVKKARDSMEYVNAAVTGRYIKTFEANVPFELRYMVDMGLNGCQWISLKAGTYQKKKNTNGMCQYVWEMKDTHSYKDVECIKTDDMGDLAPMRFLSFDIEAMRDKPGFCQADEDPVVCICARLDVIGQGKVHEAVFYFAPPGHNVNRIENASVFVFREERNMFLAFSQYIQECDPEAFTGWNITGFDWPYLSNRAKHFEAIDMNDWKERLAWHSAQKSMGKPNLPPAPVRPPSFYARFMNFSRIRYSPAYIRESVLQSKAYGAKVIHDLVCDGRFNYDGLDFMYRGQMKKYRSYTLNAISSAVLKDTKVDVDYSQIPRLHKGSDEDRTRLSYYCLKDARLPLEILDKLMAVVNGVEQARVTGVPIKWLLSRGQGIKTFSNILRYKNDWEVVPSRSPKMNNVFTAGGYVRDPIAGYYTTPIATLDFSSLYPSIMQAFNICYSTVESLKWARENLDENDYSVPPVPGVDFCFVKEHVRKGVLPDLLDSLLGQRRFVKGLMKKVDENEEPLYHAVLNGRQLALKVVCNSVYGFLKAFILIDPRLMSAVTGWGQEMIKDTADSVVEWYKDNMIVDRKACEAMGIDFDKEPAPGEPDPRPRCKYAARIIYGGEVFFLLSISHGSFTQDTDSVMVDFGDTSLQEVARLGTEAAKRCTDKFVKPNALVFESVKLTSIFMKKKRYGSLEIEGVKPGETLKQARARADIVPKGLESKRRDNAKIGSETQTKVLEQILRHENVEEAVRIVRQVIEDINMDRVDMSKYIISKGLSKTEAQYEKGGSKLLHTELRKRIKARAAETGEVVPQTGDRVPFIIKAGTGKKGQKNATKAFELSEDPVYAQEHAVPINTAYYIEKQVMAATLRIFTGIWEPHRLPEITSSMPEKKLQSMIAWKRLFAPDLPHMIVKKMRKTRNYGIGKWAKPRPQCLYPGCSRSVEGPNIAVCPDHDFEETKELLEQQVSEAEQKRDAAWDRCKKCAGGGFDEVTCSNKTCDNFFPRSRYIHDVEDLAKDMDRLSLCIKRPTQGTKREEAVVEIHTQQRPARRQKKEDWKPSENRKITSFFSK